MVKNILRVIHSIIIGFICSRIAAGYQIDPIAVGAEVVMTLLRAVVEHGLFSRNTRFQILASMVLGYTLFPNKARYISWVFFLKGIEAHKALKNVRQQASILNGKQIGKYVAFVFDVIRFSLSQFIFFGFVCAVYKFFLDCRSDPIPEPHVIIYQLVVTASTIGIYRLMKDTETSLPNRDPK